LREANQRFAQAIRAVRAGREVVLTDRGRPIAVITPVREGHTEAVALQALVDEGLVQPAARPGPTPRPRWRPLTVTGRPIAQTVIDERDDRA